MAARNSAIPAPVREEVTRTSGKAAGCLANAAVTAAKTAYIPDITAYARHSYQVGVPFLVRNYGTFGFHLTWDLFDFGRRRAIVQEREAQLAQAEENLAL